MEESLKPLFTNFALEGPASGMVLERIKTINGIELPRSYLGFLAEHNGGEGFIGSRYLVLWQAEQLEQLNRAYEVNIYAPELLLFGSNGAGEAFAFDIRSRPHKVVRVPFVGMEMRYADELADDFVSFLIALSKENVSD